MKPIQYPLAEKIGAPDLFVGRKKEFKLFNHWIANIPKRVSSSKVILARRKSGKTSFIQRIFNQLWSANGDVIPFYFDFREVKIWLPNLAIAYYCAFASQYISFIERDKTLVQERLTLQEIQEYGVKHVHRLLTHDIKSLLFDKKNKFYDSMWETVSSAPHRFAHFYDIRFLVILDEFQNTTQYIYRDKKCKKALDETMAGSYHSLAESKLAPMLVAGSYVSWLMQVIHKYFQAGRLKITRLSPYLTQEAGLQAVYQYAYYHNQAITNETAIEINALCMSDPFVIRSIMQSEFEYKDLMTKKGVIRTIGYEFTNEDSEMSMLWSEYINLTLEDVNNKNAKNILLWLYKHPERFWNPRQLKKEMSLNLSVDDIYKKLITLSSAEIIRRSGSYYQFKALDDGTLNLIIRNKFEEEINAFSPDLTKEFSEKLDKLLKENKTLRGKVNYLSGQLAEHQLAIQFRTKKRFKLKKFFQNVIDNTKLNIINVKERVQFQRPDGKTMEIDVVAFSGCGRIIFVEVKKTKVKTNINLIEDFQEKFAVYQALNPNKPILPAFLSLGGFTDEAREKCQKLGIGIAVEMKLF